MTGLAGQRLLSAFTADLIALELPGTDPEPTRAWVLERLRGAGAVTRLGLGAAGSLIGAAVLLRTGRPYHRLDDPRRRRLARALAASGAPVVAEYVKAVRALAVTHAYEQRLR